MKKRLILLSLLVTLSILSAVIFFACNDSNTDSEKEVTYSVTLTYDDDIPLSSGALQVEVYSIGNGIDLNSVKKGSNLTVGVKLRNDYDAESFKIFANGNQVEFTLNSTCNDYDYIDNKTLREIGTFTLSNVTEDINLTYEVEEQKIEINFNRYEIADNPTEAQKAVLNCFYMDGDSNSIGYYFYNNQPYYTTLSQILTTNTASGYDKSSGFLALTGGDILNGAYIYDTFSFGQGMMKALMFKEGYEGNMFNDLGSVQKNVYYINIRDYFTLIDPNSPVSGESYAKQIDISVDPSAIIPNPYGRIQNSGDVFVLPDNIQYNDFALGKNPENVTFTLNKMQGVNFDNAEILIWDTVIEPDERGVYTIDKAPIYYMSEDRLSDNVHAPSVYQIFLKGVDYSDCADLFVLNIDNEHSNVQSIYNLGSFYYQDETIIVEHKDTTFSYSYAQFEFDYYIESAEEITQLSAVSCDIIIKVNLDDTNVLTFDLGEFLPATGNAPFDQENQRNVCNITQTDKVDISYILSQTGAISGDNGVEKYIYSFNIRIGCKISSGQNSVVISQK